MGSSCNYEKGPAGSSSSKQWKQIYLGTRSGWLRRDNDQGLDERQSARSRSILEYCEEEMDRELGRQRTPPSREEPAGFIQLCRRQGIADYKQPCLYSGQRSAVDTFV